MKDSADNKNSALHISKGKSMESNINKNFKRKKRPQRSLDEFLKGILDGNRIILSQAITLIESTQSKHQELAQQIIEACLPYSGQSLRIGLTGTPGVGKSTFIDSFGQIVLAEDRQLAVLAIDPSSQLTKGSILGDKTRMETLSVHPNVFIRPSAAGASLGGVARKTRESIILCEAAGFDTIFVETVGVGQSETAVHSMVDFFLLLLLPNSGDELQGIKRGVMEMADLIAINKADGQALPAAKLAKKQCRNGLHLFPPKQSGWVATAELCSALEQTGLNTIWQHILSYQNQTTINGYFSKHRQEQAKYWFEESIQQQLKHLFYQHPSIKEIFIRIEKQVVEGQISPFKAAELLMQSFVN
ncbi:methylmalonyl Co-A mutase-associated GTPase MeaB [Aureispira sp. CCB-E]|uniref:methylmalonyl Co-A mutase-associated GTPase MeaB n=1 Tax=Aureispira sp. CCB-E TaxID=3051121 RepID=UPI0028685ABB|nr:methylmalonyl Co-A mutase-associated GTPase MeaB [Aureispira sp. CCB-E]WMX15072.1 methylmalonyl Co-A mutase-associated GTPase MeaB [Aureispira sp. CCB-E]